MPDKKEVVRYILPEDFLTLAEAVFGRRDNRQLIADHMGITTSTLRRWLSDSVPIPASAVMLLQALAQLKLNALPFPDPPTPLKKGFAPEPPLRQRVAANYQGDIDWSERKGKKSGE
jgi:hypothetical protein